MESLQNLVGQFRVKLLVFFLFVQEELAIFGNGFVACGGVQSIVFRSEEDSFLEVVFALRHHFLINKVIVRKDEH